MQCESDVHYAGGIGAISTFASYVTFCLGQYIFSIPNLSNIFLVDKAVLVWAAFSLSLQSNPEESITHLVGLLWDCYRCKHYTRLFISEVSLWSVACVPLL